ncbi:hypothetical protein [Bathymodiolus platifrons methanotrophic gill symbiont]|nr:hypothetical protein [Bathymodiolus platifrons methanotrophic gill symbiont]
MIATEPLILMQKGYKVEELKEPESLIIIKGKAKAVKAGNYGFPNHDNLS